ncbi:MAG TPA: glycosyltransferase family 2 protein [Ignavibacteriaceae bacterium]
MQKVSCVIITYNEELNIRRCLEALTWCDEIVVVDSGSKDETVKICKEFNCKIHQKDFKGFGEQKRFVVSLANNNWVLNIDADEVVTDNLKNEILSELSKPEIEFAGFHLPRSLYFLGKRFKYGKESKEYYLRLFNKMSGHFSEDKVHEKVVINGRTKKLENELAHHSYTTIHHYFEKFNSYTSKSAQELFEKGRNKSLTVTFISFPVYFLKNYLINGNILNGIEGFLWALFSSFYPVVKYAKLWTLNNKKPVR